jgi:hypothetical protein
MIDIAAIILLSFISLLLTSAACIFCSEPRLLGLQNVPPWCCCRWLWRGVCGGGGGGGSQSDELCSEDENHENNKRKASSLSLTASVATSESQARKDRATLVSN